MKSLKKELPQKQSNPDDLIQRYKGLTADVKLDEICNALNLLDKIKQGEISLVKAKHDQLGFKSKREKRPLQY